MSILHPQPWMRAIEAQVDATQLIFEAIAGEAALGARGRRSSVNNRWDIDANLLTRAQPFQWSSETSRAVLAASRSIPPDATINQWNIDSEVAWWWFEDPLPIKTTVINQNIPRDEDVRALCFGWITYEREKDYGPLIGKVKKTIRHIACAAWTDDPFNRVHIVPSQCWYWDENATLEKVIRDSRESHDRLYGPGGMYEQEMQVGPTMFTCATEDLSRFILAGLTWLGQRVLVNTEGSVEKHRRDDVERIIRTKPPRYVKIVALRRPEARPHEVDDVTDSDRARKQREYSCRWPVDGHFRNQKVGPKRSETRLTWISPYVKGPGDKPLVIPQHKVYMVNR